MGFWSRFADVEQSKRRIEAATVRKENNAEKDRIKNQERLANIKKKEAQARVREKNGGAGVTASIHFYDVELPNGKKKTVKRKR